MELALRRLQAGMVSEAEMAALTGVVLGAPAYSLLVEGRLPVAAEVPAMLTERPPASALDDKYVFGIYEGERMIGCADVLKGWKHEGQSMLGLLLLTDAAQGRGLGRRAYLQIERMVAGWPGMRSLRIGVNEANTGALAFWRKMGFAENGERHLLAQTIGGTLIMEKVL